MRGVHHDGIDPRARQGFHPLFGALAHANGSADAQLALGITRRIGKLVCLVMSLTVIRPLSSKASFTTSRRSILYWFNNTFAA